MIEHDGTGRESSTETLSEEHEPVQMDIEGSDEESDANTGEAPTKKKKRRRRRRKKASDGDAPTRDGDAPAGAVDDEAPARQPPAPKGDRPPADSKNSDIFSQTGFDELELRNSVLKGVHAAGYERATAIQAALIPVMLAGKDVLGQAKTGSGKTAAFGLPLFHLAQRALPFQSIVLVPTRELAIQIASELDRLGQFTPIRVTAVYGGQAMHTQISKLEQGPEIIVATPGRLMDMHERRHLHFKNTRIVVLDEVDRMLDIGFRDDIKKILSSVKAEHQTVFVSATISKEIEELGRRFMREDVEKIVSTTGSLTVSLVEQHYLPVEPWDKRKLLLHLLTHEDPALTLVFCRTKRTVDNLTTYLRDKKVDAHSIHGDMYQGKRNAVMNRLRGGKLAVLVCSDLAARGLDVDNISHVVNYDLPEDLEIYVHRIGRTARAGRGGVAWSLVTPEEGRLLTEIEKLANVEIPVMEYPDFTPSTPPERVRREREAIQARKETPAKFGRFDAPAAPTGVSIATEGKNDPRFPDGLVPKKLPPKRIQGVVRTRRSAARKEPKPPPTE